MTPDVFLSGNDGWTSDVSDCRLIPMIHEILQDDGIVIVTPESALTEEDFAALSRDVDAYLKTHSVLKGLVVRVDLFPGWDDLGGLIDHVAFVRTHHKMIEKVAFVTDSHLRSLVPRFAKHFVSAEMKSFPGDKFDKALEWMRGGA